MSETTETTEHTDDIEISLVGKVFFFICFWVFFGCVTAGILDWCNVLTGDTVAERFALVIFWPVFALKYLLVGGWEVFRAFVILISS